MLYNILAPLSDEFGLFNLFRYVTFRTGGAIMTALVVSFLIGPAMIRWLKVRQGNGQPIRDDGPEWHLTAKVGTPTMGGFLILIAVTLSTLLWANLSNQFVWIVLLVTLGFGMVGCADDYIKVIRQHHSGLPGRIKLGVQLLVGAVATIWVMNALPTELASGISIPFFKSVLINFGWMFVPFAVLVMVGASNAVNLTDGLDGLAIVPIMIAAACFGIISYLVGHSVFANYLHVNFVPGTGELAVFCGALVGASLGFLWFNAPPAMVFMGDTGSLSAGGALGVISVITKHELVLAIVGGLFVLEAVSVIVQVVSYKTTGRRVFRMAPLHHHFEKKGWREATIVIRFWIIASILALAGLATLKLR
ncbi:MAG: phospho-N-acetylmuramoyl-pentapeptide-transferase [Alphaproteobacteria bacterium]|nr:phospho-N-acetylmuramoyl-pentapeptide-transferase [Alphaproteobacteria bacterium]MDP6517324.1 phospho-N-acetylmuramoyl-pentapeptide-transferase [Alphaproteobacteria bacterium]